MSNTPTEPAAALPVLSYVLTEEDYNAMADAGYGRATRFLNRWMFWPFAILNVGFSAWFIGNAIEAGRPFEMAHMWNGAIAVLMILLRFCFVPWMRRWHLRQSKLAGRNYEIRFVEYDVEMSAGGLFSRINCSEILSYSETEDYFFFWINRFQAIIAPKRAINTPQGEAALRAYVADAKWKKR
ncbi:YcxB family protein [Agrobacterium rubi]|uniref:YcxB family protein n=1 Tax=Agrobacterium rubi TaxID=28099 RepID=A0AAE7R662_9HYPH|nr:YcxB family protein [Agrobacterium rubi]NTE85015.1 YcxB family protein [Agrobacterium rubi]NTF00947.1 YcxB family protein [Agrobacterium rubi]NTF35135.1 YcxB family protein [Agrobacterium rubi]OCJ48829.1 hypothetical protein A6U92_12030 [Agrobacterium rubi]QTG00347.1 YcxB family protein [Agrobacterium rubi]